MKPLRIRLLETRDQVKVPWEILERDYLLSWILIGISQVEALRTRDYYDLWRILGAYKDMLDLSQFQSVLQKKCEHREVYFLDSKVSSPKNYWSKLRNLA